MNFDIFLTWSQDMLTGFAKLGDWLITPVAKLGNVPLSPLVLFSATGLLVFISAAIVKWVVS